MVISHEHRYLFVELPHTGSTAIHAELCSNYTGENILHKHAYYHEFLKVASSEEKKYFAFSGLRNPLDEAVSIFFKYKTNHGNYINPRQMKKNGGWVNKRDLVRYHYIKDNNADFPLYFVV